MEYKRKIRSWIGPVRRGTLHFLFWLATTGAVLAQSPQMFNYQAVVRDADGHLLKEHTLDVRLTLLKGSDDGQEVWNETQTVTTNSLGLFSLQAGKVTPLTVNWGDGEYWLRTEIDPHDGSGFRELGTTRLLSVPYALYGEDADADPTNETQDLRLDGNILTITRNGNATQIDLSPYLDNPGWEKHGDTLITPGSVTIGTKTAYGTRLAVQGDDLTSEAPLFEVKRKDGQPVFAVYNEGVRVYLDASAAKGPRGGFAIGGYGVTKGSIQDLLWISADSARIYIDQSPAKGPRGGFAIGGFGVTKGSTTSMMQLTRNNYFIGTESGSHITGGLYNATMGYQAGKQLSSGSGNNFIGFRAGLNTLAGNNNNFIGTAAGYTNTTGCNNIFLGDSAGFYNLDGYSNIFIGDKAGFRTRGYPSPGASPNGSNNIMIGTQAGYSNLYGKSNILIGVSAGHSLTGTVGSGEGKGSYNVIIGYAAGYHLNGASNILIGTQAGYTLSGDHWGNTFVGVASGYANNGNENTFLGKEAGRNNTGSGNVFLGYRAGYDEEGSNKLYIDNSNTSSPLIWGDFSANRVVINGNGGSGSATLTFFVNGAAGGTTAWQTNSDARLKKNIRTIPGALDKVLQLRGVSFEWKDPQHHSRGPRIGFLAQEAEKVVPEVVDRQGPYLSMQYAPLTALLVEAIKQQQKDIEELKKEIAALRAQYETLLYRRDAGDKEQALREKMSHAAAQ